MRIRCLILIAVLTACSSAPRASVSLPGTTVVPAETDSTYGYSQTNPIKVGGVGEETPPRRQHEYLRSLRGPDGQAVSYERHGSCCMYDTPNGLMGRGMLDIYEVTYDGLKAPVVLYLTLYDLDNPRPPRGFTFAR